MRAIRAQVEREMHFQHAASEKKETKPRLAAVEDMLPHMAKLDIGVRREFDDETLPSHCDTEASRVMAAWADEPCTQQERIGRCFGKAKQEHISGESEPEPSSWESPSMSWVPRAFASLRLKTVSSSLSSDPSSAQSELPSSSTPLPNEPPFRVSWPRTGPRETANQTRTTDEHYAETRCAVPKATGTREEDWGANDEGASDEDVAEARRTREFCSVKVNSGSWPQKQSPRRTANQMEDTGEHYAERQSAVLEDTGPREEDGPANDEGIDDEYAEDEDEVEAQRNRDFCRAKVEIS